MENYNQIPNESQAFKIFTSSQMHTDDINEIKHSNLK